MIINQPQPEPLWTYAPDQPVYLDAIVTDHPSAEGIDAALTSQIQWYDCTSACTWIGSGGLFPRVFPIGAHSVEATVVVGGVTKRQATSFVVSGLALRADVIVSGNTASISVAVRVCTAADGLACVATGAPVDAEVHIEVLTPSGRTEWCGGQTGSDGDRTYSYRMTSPGLYRAMLTAHSRDPYRSTFGDPVVLEFEK